MEAGLELRLENPLQRRGEVPLVPPVALPVTLPAVEQVDSRGAWLLAWSDLRGRPLPLGFGPTVREALGLLVEVEQQGVTCHVAYHRRRQDGMEVIGLWDVVVATDGTIRWSWAERRGRGLAYCRRLRLPVRLIRQLVRRVASLDHEVRGDHLVH